MIPFKFWDHARTSRWKLVLLRLVFPRRDAVKIGQKIYLLRVRDDLTRSHP